MFSVIILFLFVLVTKLNDLDKIRDEFFYPNRFGLIFGLAIVVGLVTGFVLKKVRVRRTFEYSWEFAMKRYFMLHDKDDNKDNLIVNIITKDNREIRGIVDHASDYVGGGIILNGPTLVEQGRETRLGEILFINGDGISRVVFQGDIVSTG